MTAPLSRRAFLKLSGALSVAASWPARGGARLAATWPVPYPHYYFPNPEKLLAQNLARFDVLLLPAYAAAELIQANALQTLPGAPSRAHDPEGAFTQPYHYQIISLPLASAWPNHPRVVVGAALWARGYSPNDSHPGHLAQIEKDLLTRRPLVRPDAATLVIEYDWVIPLNANREAALAFLRHQQSKISNLKSAIPLMPFSPAARAQIFQTWERLTIAAHQ